MVSTSTRISTISTGEKISRYKLRTRQSLHRLETNAAAQPICLKSEAETEKQLLPSARPNDCCKASRKFLEPGNTLAKGCPIKFLPPLAKRLRALVLALSTTSEWRFNKTVGKVDSFAAPLESHLTQGKDQDGQQATGQSQPDRRLF
jgi:hypothetical protein